MSDTASWYVQMCRETIYVVVVSFFTGVVGAILITYGATASANTYEPTMGVIASVILGSLLLLAYLTMSIITVIMWRKNRASEVTQHVTLSEDRL